MYAGFHPDAWSVEEQVTSAASKVPVRKEELEEEKEEPTGEKEEDSGNIPSLDTLDLLSFFRREKEEAEKSTEKSGTKGNIKLAGNPDPKALLKKATNAVTFLGGESDISSTSPDPIVEKPKSILKKSHESSYTSKQNNESIDIVGSEREGSSTSAVPIVEEPSSILRKLHESQNDDKIIDIEAGPDLKTDKRENNMQSA